MKDKPQILVYMREDRLVFKGGPLAVGYCYYHEMKRRGESTLTFLPPKAVSTQAQGASYDNSKAPNRTRQLVKEYLWYVFKCFKAKTKHNLFDGYDIIHFHSTQELFLERKNLKNYSGKVILQSHSPMPLGEELYDLIELKYKRFIPFLKHNYRKMDKYAFMRADYIIFPCEDAEEPYYNRWKEYKRIHDIKRDSYRYIITGIPKVEAKRNRVEVFKELKLNDSNFVISYAGRHNEAKGYDLLKDIAETVLEQSDKAVFVVAGKEHPLTRLNHKRWIELGWTDDAKSYISASDVFILPNRETYFDLVMIEVLSLGKIVVASRTGGNKYFEKNNCPGVFLYDTKEQCVALLNKITQMSAEMRLEIGKKNFEFYQRNLTVEKMYDNYLDIISKIAHD